MNRACLNNNILNIQCIHSGLGVVLSDHLSAGTRKVVCLDRYNIATGYVLDILRGYRPFESEVTYAHKFTFDRPEKINVTTSVTSTVKARSVFYDSRDNPPVLSSGSGLQVIDPLTPYLYPTDTAFYIFLFRGDNSVLDGSYPGGVVLNNNNVYLGDGTLSSNSGTRELKYYDGTTVTMPQTTSTTYTLSDFATDIKNDFFSRNGGIEITVTPVATAYIGISGTCQLKIYFEIEYLTDEATVKDVTKVNQIDEITLNSGAVATQGPLNFKFGNGTNSRTELDGTTLLMWQPSTTTTTSGTTLTGAAVTPAAVTMTLKDNSLTYIGVGDGTDIAVYFETLIKAGGLTVDYEVERIDNVLYVYSYSSSASFSDSATITSSTTEVTATVVSLENKLDEILNIWNSLTGKELCNLITFATTTAGKTAGGSTTSSGGCNC